MLIFFISPFEYKLNESRGISVLEPILVVGTYKCCRRIYCMGIEEHPLLKVRGQGEETKRGAEKD